MRDKIIQIVSSRIFRHTVFWLLTIIVLSLLFYNDADPLRSLMSSSITVASLAVLIYFNLLYLIPRYLSKRRLISYIILLALATLVITPIRTLLTFYLYNGTAEIQEKILNSHWAVFFTMIVIVGFSTLAKIIIDWFKAERELRIMESENMQSELRFLRSQINPHFLFNTLNSLYALTLKKSDKAPDIVIQLSEMLRYMLYECNDKKVPLQKEIDYIQNYLELEQLRHSEKVDINFKRKGEINGLEISPLLFIPFLENAFKHGLNKHIEEGYVHVFLDVHKDNLTFGIKNSKPDVSEIDDYNSQPDIGGIGLQNVKRRLELLYPGSFYLDIKSSDKLYEVQLNLNLT